MPSMRPSRTRVLRSKTSCPSLPCCRSASSPCASGICRWGRSRTASSPSNAAGRGRPCRRESPTVSATTGPARVRARANTARELAPLVGQVSAEIAGGLKAYREAAAPVRRIRPRDVHVRVIGIASKARDRANRVRVAAVELTRELEVFSMEDWDRVLTGLGIPHPEEALAALVRANLVLEPTSGFYRAVSLSPEA